MQNSFISQNSLKTLNLFKQAHDLKGVPFYSEETGTYTLTLSTKEASQLISKITDHELYQELVEEGHSEDAEYLSFAGEVIILDSNSATIL